MRPALAAARLVGLGGHALEAIGRARWQRGSAHARLKAAWLHEACRRLCRLHGFSVEVAGALDATPAILVANHLSYIDPLVLGSVVPCAPIAKAELADWPLLGAGMRALGTLFVRRGDSSSGARILRASLRALAAGVSVLAFPEGSTSRDGLQPFHLGIFGIARRARVPVIPVALWYDDPCIAWTGGETFLPHYLRTVMRPMTRARVRVGQPIAPSAPADQLARAAREQIAALLERRT
jgi:1-acyl-sn-glycerol-3-phosphate acyltransferase